MSHHMLDLVVLVVVVAVEEWNGVNFNTVRCLVRVMDAGNIGWDGSLNSTENKDNILLTARSITDKICLSALVEWK